MISNLVLTDLPLRTVPPPRSVIVQRHAGVQRLRRPRNSGRLPRLPLLLGWPADSRVDWGTNRRMVSRARANLPSRSGVRDRPPNDDATVYSAQP